MKNKYSPWLLAFSAVALLELFAELTLNDRLVWLTKPLLMPFLAIWLFRETRGKRRFLHHSVLAGLLFATLGDILLLFSGGEFGALFFLLGLGAFLCTHLCYQGGFLSAVSWNKGLLYRQPLFILPFALFLGSFLTWLWPGIPTGMRWPVAAYGLAITCMALSVLNLYRRVPGPVFTMLLCGALLFMLSDCLIAVHKFGQALAGSRILIMLTYIVGQWLLVRGVVAGAAFSKDGDPAPRPV